MLSRKDIHFLSLLQLQSLESQFALSDIKLTLLVNKNTLKIAAPEERMEQIRHALPEISKAANLKLGCIVELKSYTEKKQQEEESSSMAVMMEVQNSTISSPSDVKNMTFNWIDYESVLAAFPRDREEILRIVARNQIPEFRNPETLQEGLNSEGVGLVFKSILEGLMMPLMPMNEPPEDEQKPMESTNSMPPSVEPANTNGSNSVPVKQLQLPDNYSIRHNPEGEDYSRNPNPATALNNALRLIGAEPGTSQYWDLLERFQRRRIDKEAQAFLERIASCYSEPDRQFGVLVNKAREIWDEHDSESIAVKSLD